MASPDQRKKLRDLLLQLDVAYIRETLAEVNDKLKKIESTLETQDTPEE